MTEWVALLYSVVLTQTLRLKSADLLELAANLGFFQAKTVLSTGNLIFGSTGDEATLAAAIEQELVRRHAKPIPVLVRTATEWRRLEAANPFPGPSSLDPAQVAVRVMRTEPEPATRARLARMVSPGEAFATTPRALWLASPRQLSLSPMLRAMGSAKVGIGTFRNVSAIAKISAALTPDP